MNWTQSPGLRPIACGALRRRQPRSRKATVICEKLALHGSGCVLADEQLERHPEVGLRRILVEDSKRHAGRDKTGKWYFWTEEQA